MEVLDFTKTEIQTTDVGTLGVYYLKKIWAFNTGIVQTGGMSSLYNVEWKYRNAVFNLLGIGLEPATKYLLLEQPSFEEFENWIRIHGSISTCLIEQFNRAVSGDYSKKLDPKLQSPLSEYDLNHWNEKGYVIVREAISKEACFETQKLVYKTIEASIDDPSTWYELHTLKQGIMIQLFNHPLLDQNRISPKIRGAYQQLWNRSDLLVSRDRVSFNPPETLTYKFSGPHLHWDVSLKRPIPFGLQGLLYLTDTKENQGAFTVIPGFHNKIDSWLEHLDPGVNPRDESVLYQFKLEPISANAGDFIIWNHCLPHGSCPNTSDAPRIVQYINYTPIDMSFQEEWV